jgi:hypothetical protein
MKTKFELPFSNPWRQWQLIRTCFEDTGCSESDFVYIAAKQSGYLDMRLPKSFPVMPIVLKSSILGFNPQSALLASTPGYLVMIFLTCSSENPDSLKSLIASRAV